MIHVVSAKVAASDAFQQWIKQLPGQQAVLPHDPVASLPTHQLPKQLAAAFAAEQPGPGTGQKGQQQQADAVMEEDPAVAGAAAAAAAAPDAAAADGAEPPLAAGGVPQAAPAVPAVGVSSDEVGAVPGLGFRASARVLARLHLVSQAMFPLPHALLDQKGLSPADVAAITAAYKQQQQQLSDMSAGDGGGPAQADQQHTAPQQQEQQGMDGVEGDVGAVPAVPPPVAAAPGAAPAATAAVAAPQAGPTHAPRPPKVVCGQMLQQLNWSGLLYMALQPALVPPLAHKVSFARYHADSTAPILDCWTCGTPLAQRICVAWQAPSSALQLVVRSPCRQIDCLAAATHTGRLTPRPSQHYLLLQPSPSCLSCRLSYPPTHALNSLTQSSTRSLLLLLLLRAAAVRT